MDFMQTSNFASGLWTDTACPAPETPPFDGARKADVVVVGGGYTGLSAALHLAEEGADVVLLEAETPGFGASGRNNGQVIPAYTRHNPDDVVRAYGTKQGERLNRWVAGSADLVFDLIRRHDIACDAAQQGWLQPAHAASRLAGLRAKHDQWAARGAAVEMVDRDFLELTAFFDDGDLTALAHKKDVTPSGDCGGRIIPATFPNALTIDQVTI